VITIYLLCYIGIAAYFCLKIGMEGFKIPYITIFDLLDLMVLEYCPVVWKIDFI
jgi:hypothetical protein